MTRLFAHPHAEYKKPNLFHQGVLSDLLFPFFLRGIWVIAPLAQFHVHDAWFDKASAHILQFQVQVWHSKHNIGFLPVTSPEDIFLIQQIY